MELFRDLKAVESGLLCLVFDLIINKIFDFVRLDKIFIISNGEVVSLSIFLNFFLRRHYNCHNNALERVAIDKNLLDKDGFLKGVFDLLRGNILALRKFKDIFLSINDFETSVW